MHIQTWVLIASFFLILLLLILINSKVNGGFKVETSWIAVALSPALIWLLTTGQLGEFSGFGFALKLREASARPFSLKLEGNKIEPQAIPQEEKEGIAKIPEFIQRRIGALTYQLNRKGYYSNWVTQRYLEELTPYEFFRYVVFVSPEGQFRGLVPASDLLEQIEQQNLDFVNIIEEGEIDRLNGLIRVSVSTNSSKRDALKKMEEQKLSNLPVVDEAGQFIGIVERTKLISSILVSLITQP